MKKRPLANIMETKFKKLVLVFFIFFTAMLIIGAFLLYNHFYESAKNDVYNDINFYFMELDNNFSVMENRVNDIFKEELNDIYNSYNNDFNVEKEIVSIENRLTNIEALNNNVEIDDLNYYLISKNGEIIESSYEEDLGLDLSEDDEIWGKLSSLNNGEVFLDSFDDEKRSNDVNIYSYLKLDNGNIFELGLSFSNINSIIKDQLNYLLSDKKTNITLYTEGYTPYFNDGNNLNDNEKIIFQESISQNKTIEKNAGFFAKNYYRGWENNYGNRFVKVQVKYNLYKNALYILLLIFIFVLGFQLFLHYSFKEIVASVTGPIRNLSEKMNNFTIKENMNFNLKTSDIKEINDIQDNFKDMIEEVNANYEQLEAYNNEIINKNERLNEINKDLDKNKRKYKNLFNNMLDGFAYYKIIYNDKMEAIDYQLIEANEAFKNLFNLDSVENLEKDFEDYFPISKKIFLNKYNEIIKGKKNNFQFEKYFSDKDRWLNINIFSTYKGYLATVISDITELKESKRESERLSTNLEKIISLTSALATNNLGENKFLQRLLKTAVEVIPEADYGTVYKNENGSVKFIDAIGHDFEKFKNLSLDKKYFYNNNEEIEVIENVMRKNESKFDDKNLQILKEGQKELKETMTFDLIVDNEIVAGLNLDIKLQSKEKFDDYSKRLFKSLKNISTSFYKMRKYNILQNKFTKELILSIIRMLEIHDLYTRGHSEKVANLSKMIAKQLNLSEKKMNDAYWAGMVHDIGKILIPDYILNKKSSLKDNEFEIIKKHSVWGYQTLSATEDLQNIARFVLFHHERWDGEGYPRGLKGEEIPLISRILAVADAWDAMTTDRAYRKALSKEEAIKELKDNKGKQFDPKIVDAFLKGHLS
ncbi:MAG: HD domain-containing phosphohydrolase [Bacillota bacterium]